MTKPKTQEQLNRAASARLLKTYGITLAEYERLAEVHKQGCWICESVPVSRRLHVDHDHGWKKVVIVAEKRIDGLWGARAFYNGNNFGVVASSKKAAKDEIRQQLKRASIRGLLCYQHNAGLQKFRDNPLYLRNAANYLEWFQNGSTDRILNGDRT